MATRAQDIVLELRNLCGQSLDLLLNERHTANARSRCWEVVLRRSNGRINAICNRLQIKEVRVHGLGIGWETTAKIKARWMFAHER
jgi:hypothetical protein